MTDEELRTEIRAVVARLATDGLIVVLETARYFDRAARMGGPQPPPESPPVWDSEDVL